jgi:type II secretory ATPase GspE/PulE/Tfp pilus assembly ATPase PilB-like protein
VALTEAITINHELKKLIHDDSSEAELTKQAFKNTASIQSSSTELLLEGITTFEELLRLQNNNDVEL